MQSVEVPPRIDAENAVEVLAQLSQALAAGDLSGDSAGGSGDGRETSGAAARSPLALDLAPLKAFDSSALSLLLQLARSRRGEGGADGGANGNGNGRDDMTPAQPLFLLNPPAKLQELAELYGVAAMLFGSPDKGVGAGASE